MPEPRAKRAEKQGQLAWFVIFTKPRQEAVAADAIKQDGIETFHPKFRRKVSGSREKGWKVRSMFPGYIFARLDSSLPHSQIRYTHGVIRIIAFKGIPAKVPDALIEEIRSRCKDEMLCAESTELHPGDLVEVQDGPLRGYQGLFAREINDKDRALVLLNILARNVETEVPRSLLEKV